MASRIEQLDGACDRVLLVRKARRLEYASLAYNSLEAVASVITGVLAGSVALVAFGMDSLIEVTSGAALLWRLGQDRIPEVRERAERLSLRVVGGCFIALALYVAVDALKLLMNYEVPERTWFGVAIAVGSLIVMPVLARSKRRVARDMSSQALAADSAQTNLCACLSAILLGGLLLNAVLGWWWADPAASLVMVPIIMKEGVEVLRARSCGCDHERSQI
ncbi:MAG TPA: cation transporter [Terriglobales bacterium]|nr:cation transporter [Terriglobales bacterium]